MLPSELKAEDFHSYPPEARRLAGDYLETFRQLPLTFLPNLLREVMDFDFAFPAERKTVQCELGFLRALPQGQREEVFRGFQAIRIAPRLEQLDWVNAPAQFVEQLSAELWTTGQLDAFRKAALEYAERLGASLSPDALAMPRLVIVVVGKDAESPQSSLFRKLRARGAYFTSIAPERGLEQLLRAVEARAQAHPEAYGHWYIDGGPQAQCSLQMTCVSYAGLEPVRAALLARIQAETKKPGMGPEVLRSLLAAIRPEELGAASGDAVLDRFQVKLLTEGSGTQIFSTSFVQWAAREALRRAEPLTLLVRFAPRQSQKPMNELLSPTLQPPQLDALGSLVDADMAAYYCFLNQQRLPGAAQSMFLAWFENHGEAIAISPSMPGGTVSTSAATIEQLLSWLA